ncbi:MAG: hypothetical protein IKC68_02775 [Bacteroidales bacterium]|nr:hypothetical protein [Bacteroidales bacterium]MBR2857312.1 hypothetical protein [Bacteroidales bacterium]
MRGQLGIIAAILIVLPAVSSCRAISSFLRGGEVIAEAGSEKLYRSDLDKVIPKGISAEDSTYLAKQYINAWATDLVYLSIAEQQLSKSEKDVTKELEDYRKSLLKYRYEQLYVNERLDTAVSDDKVEEYYNAHQDKFVLNRPLVKARFLSISDDSPAKDQIRKRMSSDEVEDLVEADSLAYSAALKYATWSDQWIDVATLAREFSMDYTIMLGQMKNRWIDHVDTLGVARMAYVPAIMQKGEVAPLEYSAPSIRDIIISARKQALISTLEQDLLNDARENGKFVIY